MEINFKTGILQYEDFRLDISTYDVVLTDSKTLCHSTRDKFFIAYLNESNKITVYTISSLTNVVLVGTICYQNVLLYYLRQRENDNGEFKTICLFLKYNEFTDRFRELDFIFLEAECERLEWALGEWKVHYKLLYVYSKNTFIDPASFLISKINFENEQLVTETEFV